MRSLYTLAIVCLLAVPSTAASGDHHGPATEWIEKWLTTRQLPSEADAAVAVEEAGYPLPAPPERRFADWLQREELAAAGDLTGAQRVLRFIQVTDMQLVDDDAPTPVRYTAGDPVFYNAGVSGGAERPQDEYADEIMHSMIDVINQHHAQDPAAFVLHTGDNIDNALENEMMRYLDLVEGTHTTIGPLTGFQCQPDGQSTGIDDDSSDVTDACTSVPEHVVPELRGLAPGLPWFSMNGNHDTLIQGNVVPQPEYNLAIAQFGRYWMSGQEFVAMHFAGTDSCAGAGAVDPTVPDDDDHGHGFAFAGERLCDGDVDNDAYYAYTHNGIRFIVLDTVSDEVYQTNSNLALVPTETDTGRDFASGLSQGALDLVQWQWLQDELAASMAMPVVIVAHHSIKSFYSSTFDPLCAPVGCFNDVLTAAGFVGTEHIQAEITSHPNVIAYIGGHTHRNRVTPQALDGNPGTYWNIETSGLLDFPQESRILELWVTADGTKAFWALDPIGHLFDLARDLALTDTEEDAVLNNGEDIDRRILAWFDLPPGIAFTPGAQPPTIPIHLIGGQLPTEVHPGSLDLSVQVARVADGVGVPGLTVEAGLFQATLDDGTVVSFGNLSAAADAGDGMYSTTIDIPDSAFAQVLWTATDPAGDHAANTLLVSFPVAGADHHDEEDSPAPALILAVFALALAFAVRRQRPA